MLWCTSTLFEWWVCAPRSWLRGVGVVQRRHGLCVGHEHRLWALWVGGRRVDQQAIEPRASRPGRKSNRTPRPPPRVPFVYPPPAQCWIWLPCGVHARYCFRCSTRSTGIRVLISPSGSELLTTRSPALTSARLVWMCHPCRNTVPLSLAGRHLPVTSRQIKRVWWIMD